MNSRLSPVILALLKIIEGLVAEGFWGQITIKFKDGEPILVQREQQIKLK